MTGQEIVDYVMGANLVGPKDFFSRTRMPHVVEARREAALALKRAGLSDRAAARIMKCHRTTIAYWATPGRREKMKAHCLNYWHTYASPNATIGSQT